jgi:hypothetical protein
MVTQLTACCLKKEAAAASDLPSVLASPTTLSGRSGSYSSHSCCVSTSNSAAARGVHDRYVGRLAVAVGSQSLTDVGTSAMVTRHYASCKCY